MEVGSRRGVVREVGSRRGEVGSRRGVVWEVGSRRGGLTSGSTCGHNSCR